MRSKSWIPWLMLALVASACGGSSNPPAYETFDEFDFVLNSIDGMDDECRKEFGTGREYRRGCYQAWMQGFEDFEPFILRWYERAQTNSLQCEVHRSASGMEVDCSMVALPQPTQSRAPEELGSFGDYSPPTTRYPAVTYAWTPDTQPATGTENDGCHPSYEGACVPIGVRDVDCQGGTGDGPYYVGRVRVVGRDVYRLDSDHDGIGCE